MTEPVICHIDTGRKFRGGQRQAFLLIERLQRAGIEQILACPSGSELGRRVDRVPLVELSSNAMARKIMTGGLQQAIAEQGINIIHAHDSDAHTIGLLLKRKNSALRLVVSRRVVFPPSSKFSANLKYRGRVDRYIAISRAVAGSLAAIGVDEDRIELIPSGLDLDKIRRDAEEWFDPGEKLRKHKYLIVTSGSLTEEKDFPTAVRAMELVSGKVPEAGLAILGEGPLGKKLVDMIIERQLSNVHLLGHREPMAPVFAIADIFLLTSSSEGLNSSAIEAAACGLPLVVSKIGGLPEIAEQNYNGLLCYPGNAEAFASALVSLLKDSRERRRMSANSREKSRQFNIEMTAQKTIDLYNGLLVESKKDILS